MTVIITSVGEINNTQYHQILFGNVSFLLLFKIFNGRIFFSTLNFKNS